jgi:hypothetical protein
MLLLEAKVVSLLDSYRPCKRGGPKRHQLGTQAATQLYRFLAVSGFCDHLQVAVRLEGVPDRGPEQGMVVGYDDPRRCLCHMGIRELHLRLALSRSRCYLGCVSGGCVHCSKQGAGDRSAGPLCRL